MLPRPTAPQKCRVQRPDQESSETDAREGPSEEDAPLAESGDLRGSKAELAHDVVGVAAVTGSGGQGSDRSAVELPR